MGILQRIREVLRTNANAIIDKATDPAKQVELLLAEIQDQKKAATAELISYKATEKRLTQELDAATARVAEWQKRAESAVRAGDDELARKALVEKQRAQEERAQIAADRNEQAHYAAELLKSRRALEQRLTDLELRKGTIINNLAAARAGGQTVLSPSGKTWSDMERAEGKIDDEAALAEVEAMLGDPLAAGDEVVEAKLRQKMAEAQAADALAELKKKMGR